MILNEVGDLGNLTIIEDSTVLKNRVAIALNKELGRTALSKFAVASMHMHTFYHTERGKIQVITRHLEIVILRHSLILHVFKVLLQIAACYRKFYIIHRSLQYFTISIEDYSLVWTIEVQNLDMVIRTSKCIPVDNDVSIISDILYIRHKQYEHF